MFSRNTMVFLSRFRLYEVVIFLYLIPHFPHQALNEQKLPSQAVQKDVHQTFYVCNENQTHTDTPANVPSSCNDKSR